MTWKAKPKPTLMDKASYISDSEVETLRMLKAKANFKKSSLEHAKAQFEAIKNNIKLAISKIEIQPDTLGRVPNLDAIKESQAKIVPQLSTQLKDLYERAWSYGLTYEEKELFNELWEREKHFVVCN